MPATPCAGSRALDPLRRVPLAGSIPCAGSPVPDPLRWIPCAGSQRPSIPALLGRAAKVATQDKQLRTFLDANEALEADLRRQLARVAQRMLQRIDPGTVTLTETAVADVGRFRNCYLRGGLGEIGRDWVRLGEIG